MQQYVQIVNGSYMAAQGISGVIVKADILPGGDLCFVNLVDMYPFMREENKFLLDDYPEIPTNYLFSLHKPARNDIATFIPADNPFAHWNRLKSTGIH